MRRFVAASTTLIVGATLLLVAGPADAGSRYTVTASASTAKVDVGQSFTLRGKVTPKASGQKVKVQRLAGSTWTTIARATLNRRSKYAATVTVTAPGDNRYRVVKPKSAGHKKGVSPTVTVVGWHWRALTSFPVRLESNYTFAASGYLGPVLYQPFARLGSPSAGSGYVAFEIAGKCAAFDGHAGVTTDSVGDVDVAHEVRLIGSTASDPNNYDNLAENRVYRGEDPVHFVRGAADITPLERLGFDANTGAGLYVGWGGSQVYCRS
jgi:hypothetical protein